MFQKVFRSRPHYAWSICDAENWFSYEYCFYGHLLQVLLDMNSTANGSQDGKKAVAQTWSFNYLLTFCNFASDLVYDPP